MLEKIALFFKRIFDYLKSDISIFQIFKKALSVTNNNIILVCPLIFFVMFASIYLYVAPTKTFNIIYVLLLFFAMSAVFFSGWFYIIMLAVKGKQNNEDVFELLKQFPTGVATHFLRFLLMIAIFFVLLTFVLIATYKSAYLLIGTVGIPHQDLFIAMSSPEAMAQLLKNLTIEQQIKLSQWNLYFIFTTTLYSFIVMLWAPEIVFKQESVLKSFLNSIVKIGKSFFKALVVFLFIMMLYLIIMILSALINIQIMQFVITTVYFYFLLYSAVLIFLFYMREFSENE